jgi:folate-binding Fe-S cluster repair protein YgfZ
VAHGLGQALRDAAVSYTKGCYTGQELVARMQSRGASAPWELRAVTLSAEVAPGTALGDPERSGEVTTVVVGRGGEPRALCVLHRRDAERAEVEVHDGRGTVARLDG